MFAFFGHSSTGSDRKSRTNTGTDSPKGGSLIENAPRKFFSTFQLFWLRFVSEYILLFFSTKKGFAYWFSFLSLTLLFLAPSAGRPERGQPFLLGFRFVSFGFVELSLTLCLHSHTKGLNGILKEFGKRIASNRRIPRSQYIFFFFLLFSLIFLGTNHHR